MNPQNTWEKKLEKILYSRFGATAISVSMAEGNVTDGTIKIRDDGINEVKKLFEKTLTSYKAKLREEIRKKAKDPCEVGLDDGEGYDENEGYNLALSDILSLIESTKI